MPLIASNAEPQRTRATVGAISVRLALALARAHLRSRVTHGSGRTSLVLGVLGMGVGVMMLTSVLGVMNGLQLGFIEDLVEIGSFHLRVQREDDRAVGPEVLRDLRDLTAVRTITPFADLTAMVGRLRSEGRHGMTLRAVPADVGTKEPAFAAQIGLTETPIAAGTVIIGVEAAVRLGVSVGDAVSVDLIDRSAPVDGGRPLARATPLIVAGMFASGYYEYDLGWALVSLSTAGLITSGQLPLEYGIKLVDRFRDQPARAAVEALLAVEHPAEDYVVRSWREFNQALYGALRTEKLLMSALIGLVFMVVSFNVFHLMRRRIQERRQEIGVLRALGATPEMLQAAYALEAAAVGAAGVACGVAAGMVIAGNLTALLALTESVTNALLSVAARMTSIPRTHLHLSNTSTFYIDVVPSRILLHEAVLTCSVAIGAGLAAALAAGRWLRSISPERVLRETRR